MNSANAVQLQSKKKEAEFGVPIQRGKKQDIGGGVTVTQFKSFTGGSIFEFRLNSGNESPFHSNTFSIHAMKGKGTPSALNSKNVNPALLGKVAEYLKVVKVSVSAQNKQKQDGLKLFLEPKPQALPVDWASLNLARADKPVNTGLYDPDNHELHG